MGILIPGSTTWREAAPAFLVALALLWTPGAVAAALLRLRVVATLAVAPALSTTCLGLSGIIAPLVGLRWGLLPLALGTVLMWGVAAVIGVRVRARASSSRETPLRVRIDPAGRRELWSRHGVTLTTLFGAIVAFTIFLFSVLGEIHSPEAFPQHPDTIFHLAAPQWMLEHGTISSLSAGKFNVETWTGFYPAAMYGFTATISMLTGVSVTVATSVWVIAVAGIVWPLGVTGLALSLFGRRPVVALASSIAAVSFTGFPYFLMGFGVLWPNLFGGALLPGCLLGLVSAIGSRARPPYVIAGRPTSTLIVVACLPGLVMAHPNAFASFCLFALLCLTGRALAQAWALRARRPRVALLVAAGTVVTLLLSVAVTVALRRPSMFATGAPGPEASTDKAWYAVLNFAPRSTRPLTLLSVVVGIGIIAVIWRYRGARWVVAAFATLTALFWLNVAVDATWTRYLTWPWYNNAVRLQSVAVLPAALLATAGFVFVSNGLVRLSKARLPGAHLVAPLLVVGLFLATTGGGFVSAHLHIVHRYFHPKAADSWASDKELRSLRALSKYLPADAVVAANPWNGPTYLYIVSGRQLLVPTEKTNFPGDRQLLSKNLDRVGTDPEVCAAAQRQHVEWAITGGRPFSWAQSWALAEFTGVDNIGSSPAWQKVAKRAPYTLYKRTACAGAGT
ncbi:DUF6541 family protein [Terrabacter sp. AAH1]